MTAHVTQLISQAVAEEQERLRARIAAIIESAVGLSEAEVMAATANITSINAEALQHAADLRDLAAGLGGERQGVAGVLDHQTRFCAEAVALLREQAQVAERSLHLGREIDGFVDTIGNLSARVLSISGQIESARLGSEGAAFMVIAGQMRELGRDVHSANDSISGLAEGLGQLMPVLQDNAQALLALTEHFSAQQSAEAARFAQASGEAQERMDQALGEGRDRAERILSRSGDMLSRLQFQDRMAQELRDILDLFQHTQDILAGFFARLGAGAAGAGGPPELDEARVKEALREAQRDTPMAGGRLGQQGDGPEADLPESGEVLLF